MYTDRPAGQNSDDEAAPAQVLDGAELLTCTVATMDVLRRALSDELGLDEAEEYGLVPRGRALAAADDRRDQSAG